MLYFFATKTSRGKLTHAQRLVLNKTRSFLDARTSYKRSVRDKSSSEDKNTKWNRAKDNSY